jgi:hypothetical protein
MNELLPYSDEQKCIKLDSEIVQARKKDDCLAAYKEFGKSEAQKVDTSRGCEMVYLRVALFRANTVRNVNKKVKLCAHAHAHARTHARTHTFFIEGIRKLTEMGKIEK